VEIQFWGAAQTTTGSLHLLKNAGQTYALDCGLFQGRRAEYYERNEDFPEPPSQWNGVILSHGHIDHLGNLPTAFRRGFDGPIWATSATVDLGRALLYDSAHIQELDVEFVNRKRAKRGEAPVKPLYTASDVDAVMNRFTGLGYYARTPIGDGVTCRFLDAGHILGSAIVELDLAENGQRRRVVFSGDLGRPNPSILRPADIPNDTEVLIIESTYGGRRHPPAEDLRNALRDLVRRVIDRRGKLIIPAFSVGRTQEITYTLNSLWNAGELPRVPVYVDSPLSTNVTEIFRNHPECYNRQTRELMLRDEDPFGFATLTYIRSVEASKKLNDREDPMIILAASGMCEAGRILHHLRNSIDNPRNCVLIAGFQAENTLGRKIVEREPVVRIFGEEVPLKAEVVVMTGFSAHADSEELLDFVWRVNERGRALKKIFLVHGEPEQIEALAGRIRSTLRDGVEITTPKRGETFKI